MNGKTIYSIVVMMFASTTHIIPTIAASSPQLELQINQGLQAGFIRDGTKLGKGTMISYDNHVGFELSGGSATRTLQPGRYVLIGKHNPFHQVRVCLSLSQVPVTEQSDSQGIRIHTSDDRVIFDILSDGDQLVKADSYTIIINATTLFP